MKLKIKTFEYVKVEKEAVEYDFPDVPSHYFETGIRRSIRVEPVWTTWKKENELKGLKAELALLDRKIQLKLSPPTIVIDKKGKSHEVKG